MGQGWQYGTVRVQRAYYVLRNLIRTEPAYRTSVPILKRTVPTYRTNVPYVFLRTVPWQLNQADQTAWPAHLEPLHDVN